jgi:antitoxin VapB
MDGLDWECPCFLDFAFRVRRIYSMYIQECGPMAIAKVFRSGNSQAVRLPKQFRLDAEEVEIFRRGDELVLRERARDLGRAFELLSDLPEDAVSDRADTLPQDREGL